MEYREIYNNSGYYAREDGRIFSTNARKGHKTVELTQRVSNSGYLMVSLSINGKYTMCYVHRLMALAFLPNPDNKPEVDHVDGNKLNNTVSNLEWVSPSENNSRYRSQKVKRITKTSCRSGTLYHETEEISHFRSLQQAKLFCKAHFGCSLSTVGSKNINSKNHLFFIRDDSSQDINDIWSRFLLEKQQTEASIQVRVQAEKGTSGTVYNNNVFVKKYPSIRAANADLSCCFHKRRKYYQTGPYVFVPDDTLKM